MIEFRNVTKVYEPGTRALNGVSLKIEDATSPVLDADTLRRDPTVRGEFYRLLESALNDEDEKTRETAAAALRAGLSALAGESVVM